MRYLILSDIHANQTALEAALAAMQGRWDKAVCLGDVVGYGPDPNEVIDRVRGLVAACIRGNHDKASCGLDSAEDFNPVARRAALWTREQLTAENLAYLQNLPQGPVEVDGITLMHGAWEDEDEYVFSPAQALDGLLGPPTMVSFFGHTHFQGGFSFVDNTLEVIQLRPAEGTSFAAMQVNSKTRYLLNPGSVGQPRDGDPRAAFALADLEHNVVEFWRVPYNIEAVQSRMSEAGLPEPLVMRLAYGR
ncbi:MAG TPA: metallophosphoesterase family protein [Candidatus Acidoferrales bacterium]|jgi:predicted phosphodiesterase|nr:metallophosphoesterase family protein [Candidatus Acidoferrales bacterium]